MIIDTKVRIITKANSGSSLFKIKDVIGNLTITAPEVTNGFSTPTLGIKYIDNGKPCPNTHTLIIP
jgi:hypothetical protein